MFPRRLSFLSVHFVSCICVPEAFPGAPCRNFADFEDIDIQVHDMGRVIFSRNGNAESSLQG